MSLISRAMSLLQTEEDTVTKHTGGHELVTLTYLKKTVEEEEEVQKMM